MSMLKRIRSSLKGDKSASYLRAARSGNIEKVSNYLKNNSVDINVVNSQTGLSALHLASKEGHANIVKLLLESGVKVNTSSKTASGLPSEKRFEKLELNIVLELELPFDELPWTTSKGTAPLHIAALAGQLEVVKLLVSRGADINAQSQDGFTPLYMAAQENHVDVVRYLLANGADQSLSAKGNFSPLTVSVQQGHYQVTVVLLEAEGGTRLELPAIHVAARKDLDKAAALLLSNGHDANAVTKSGFTPLHIAAHYGNANVARQLIAKKANVNFKAKNDIVPLHVASKWGRDAIITLLADSGAVIDSRTKDGLTPFHCAARNGHVHAVALLLERRACVTARTSRGLTPLHLAVQGDHVDTAKLLVTVGHAPVDEITNDGLSSLHIAAHCGHFRSAKLLLELKCLPAPHAKNGMTPLHVASQRYHLKIVELLLSSGAPVDVPAQSGATPLHVASFAGHLAVVECLLRHGARTDSLMTSQLTPLHLAAAAGRSDVIRALLGAGANLDAVAANDVTPLKAATAVGNVNAISVLLQARQDVASPDQASNSINDAQANNIALKMNREERARTLSTISPNVLREQFQYVTEDDQEPPLTNGAEVNELVTATTAAVQFSPPPQEAQKSEAARGVDDVAADVTTRRDRHVDASGSRKGAPQSARRNRFLVSFVVDARGGSMTGRRRRGLRIVVPQGAVCMPTRVTCRLVRADRARGRRLPPLGDGDGLAVGGLLEVGPVGERFDKPLTVEVPHYASLKDGQREIVVWRSFDGEKWIPHKTFSTSSTLTSGTPDGDKIDGTKIHAVEDSDLFDATGHILDDLDGSPIQTIHIETDEFPRYFAIVSRFARQVEHIIPDGSLASLQNGVKVAFPAESCWKTTEVHLHTIPVSSELLTAVDDRHVTAASPVVVIEPQRRKFHRPVTISVPMTARSKWQSLGRGQGRGLPTAATSCELRLLCSVSDANNELHWEDITTTTPLTATDDGVVSFSTSVSAKYWVLEYRADNKANGRLSSPGDLGLTAASPSHEGNVEQLALDLYREAIAVPYLATVTVFGRRHSHRDGRLQVFCMTDERSVGKTLERRDGYVKITKVRHVEVIEGRPVYAILNNKSPEVDNLEAVGFESRRLNQLPLMFRFRAFHENRLPFTVSIRDVNSPPVGHLTVTSQGRPPLPVTAAASGSRQTTVLDVHLPEWTGLEGGADLEKATTVAPLQNAPAPDRSLSEEQISKAELRLTDIAEAVQSDWSTLATQLGISEADIGAIQSDFEADSERALVALHFWVQGAGENCATGNDLERALKAIGRDDVIRKCMYNVREVTDLEEKAMARTYLDTGFDQLRDEIGSYRELGSSRASSVQHTYSDYESSLYSESVESGSLRSDFGPATYGRRGKADNNRDNYAFVDRSRTPSFYTASPAESDAETATGYGSELEADVEYELEEVWDGKQWQMVHRPAPVTTETPAGNAENRVELPVVENSQSTSAESKNLSENPVEALEPAPVNLEQVEDTIAAPSVAATAASEPKEIETAAVAAEEPKESVTTLNAVEPASAAVDVEPTPLTEVDESCLASTNVSDQLQPKESVSSVPTETANEIPAQQQQRQLDETPVVKEKPKGDDEDDDLITTTEVEEGEEMLDDGTLVRKKVTTTKQLKPKMTIIRKKGSLPHYEATEQVVGTDIEEEVLKMEPDILGLDESQLESETVVEESEESLEDGTWVRHKVTTVALKRRRSTPKSEGRRLMTAAQNSNDEERKEKVDEYEKETVKAELTDQQPELLNRLPSVTEEAVPQDRVEHAEEARLDHQEATIDAHAQVPIESGPEIHADDKPTVSAECVPYESHASAIGEQTPAETVAERELPLAAVDEQQPVISETSSTERSPTDEKLSNKVQVTAPSDSIVSETVEEKLATADERELSAARASSTEIPRTEPSPTDEKLSNEVQVTAPSDSVVCEPVEEKLALADEGELSAARTSSTEVPRTEPESPATESQCPPTVSQTAELDASKPAESQIDHASVQTPPIDDGGVAYSFVPSKNLTVIKTLKDLETTPAASAPEVDSTQGVTSGRLPDDNTTGPAAEVTKPLSPTVVRLVRLEPLPVASLESQPAVTTTADVAQTKSDVENLEITKETPQESQVTPSSEETAEQQQPGTLANIAVVRLTKLEPLTVHEKQEIPALITSESESQQLPAVVDPSKTPLTSSEVQEINSSPTEVAATAQLQELKTPTSGISVVHLTKLEPLPPHSQSGQTIPNSEMSPADEQPVNESSENDVESVPTKSPAITVVHLTKLEPLPAVNKTVSEDNKESPDDYRVKPEDFIPTADEEQINGYGVHVDECAVAADKTQRTYAVDESGVEDMIVPVPSERLHRRVPPPSYSANDYEDDGVLCPNGNGVEELIEEVPAADQFCAPNVATAIMSGIDEEPIVEEASSQPVYRIPVFKPKAAAATDAEINGDGESEISVVESSLNFAAVPTGSLKQANIPPSQESVEFEIAEYETVSKASDKTHAIVESHKSEPEATPENVTAVTSSQVDEPDVKTAADVAALAEVKSEDVHQPVVQRTEEVGQPRTVTEEEETVEQNNDGRTLTRTVKTTTFYQPVIHQTVVGGKVTDTRNDEILIGKYIDEYYFDAPIDLVDPNSASVETQTSVDESEETLEDGTWLRKKVTRVIAYIGEDDDDSGSSLSPSVTVVTAIGTKPDFELKPEDTPSVQDDTARPVIDSSTEVLPASTDVTPVISEEKAGPSKENLEPSGSLDLSTQSPTENISDTTQQDPTQLEKQPSTASETVTLPSSAEVPAVTAEDNQPKSVNEAASLDTRPSEEIPTVTPVATENDVQHLQQQQQRDISERVEVVDQPSAEEVRPEETATKKPADLPTPTVSSVETETAANSVVPSPSAEQIRPEEIKPIETVTEAPADQAAVSSVETETAANSVVPSPSAEQIRPKEIKPIETVETVTEAPADQAAAEEIRPEEIKPIETVETVTEAPADQAAVSSVETETAANSVVPSPSAEQIRPKEIKPIETVTEAPADQAAVSSVETETAANSVVPSPSAEQIRPKEIKPIETVTEAPADQAAVSSVETETAANSVVPSPSAEQIRPEEIKPIETVETVTETPANQPVTSTVIAETTQADSLATSHVESVKEVPSDSSSALNVVQCDRPDTVSAGQESVISLPEISLKEASPTETLQTEQSTGLAVPEVEKQPAEVQRHAEGQPSAEQQPPEAELGSKLNAEPVPNSMAGELKQLPVDEGTQPVVGSAEVTQQPSEPSASATEVDESAVASSVQPVLEEVAGHENDMKAVDNASAVTPISDSQSAVAAAETVPEEETVVLAQSRNQCLAELDSKLEAVLGPCVQADLQRPSAYDEPDIPVITLTVDDQPATFESQPEAEIVNESNIPCIKRSKPSSDELDSKFTMVFKPESALEPNASLDTATIELPAAAESKGVEETVEVIRLEKTQLQNIESQVNAILGPCTPLEVPKVTVDDDDDVIVATSPPAVDETRTSKSEKPESEAVEDNVDAPVLVDKKKGQNLDAAWKAIVGPNESNTPEQESQPKDAIAAVPEVDVAVAVRRSVGQLRDIDEKLDAVLGPCVDSEVQKPVEEDDISITAGTMAESALAAPEKKPEVAQPVANEDVVVSVRKEKVAVEEVNSQWEKAIEKPTRSEVKSEEMPSVISDSVEKEQQSIKVEDNSQPEEVLETAVQVKRDNKNLAEMEGKLETILGPCAAAEVRSPVYEPEEDIQFVVRDLAESVTSASSGNVQDPNLVVVTEDVVADVKKARVEPINLDSQWDKIMKEPDEIAKQASQPVPTGEEVAKHQENRPTEPVDDTTAATAAVESVAVAEAEVQLKHNATEKKELESRLEAVLGPCSKAEIPALAVDDDVTLPLVLSETQQEVRSAPAVENQPPLAEEELFSAAKKIPDKLDADKEIDWETLSGRKTDGSQTTDEVTPKEQPSDSSLPVVDQQPKTDATPVEKLPQCDADATSPVVVQSPPKPEVDDTGRPCAAEPDTAVQCQPSASILAPHEPTNVPISISNVPTQVSAIKPPLLVEPSAVTGPVSPSPRHSSSGSAGRPRSASDTNREHFPPRYSRHISRESPVSFVDRMTSSTYARSPTPSSLCGVDLADLDADLASEPVTMPDGSLGHRRLVKKGVKKLVTRKIRKVRSDGEVVEDIVTEEVPDYPASGCESGRSSRRSGSALSDIVVGSVDRGNFATSSGFMSPCSPGFASPAAERAASPALSTSSRSSLKVYTDTVEGEPEVTTDVQEREETLPDGRVVIRKLIRTRQKQTIVKRIVMEGPSGDDVCLSPLSDVPSGDLAEGPAAVVVANQTTPEVRTYSDTVDLGPKVETETHDVELIQPDGTVSKKTVTKTTTRQLRAERSLVEGQNVDVPEKAEAAAQLHAERTATPNSQPGDVIGPSLARPRSAKPRFKISMEPTGSRSAFNPTANQQGPTAQSQKSPDESQQPSAEQS